MFLEILIKKGFKMKKIFISMFFVFTTVAVYSQTLDVAVEEAARGISGRLSEGTTIVAIEFLSNSERLSNHVIDEMNDRLVNIGKIRPVERRRINAIRSELNINMTGEVSDESAQRIGHMLGAQYIILGSIDSIGTQYRIRFRAITTETSIIEWSFSQNIKTDAILENLMGRISATDGTGERQRIQSTIPAVTTPPIAGTIVPGNNLTERFAWLQRSADSHNTYILQVSADETISPYVFEYSGTINITIVLRGDNINRIIRLRSHGNMFIIRSNVTLILDNNITLHGHNGNNSLVVVDGGTLRMNTGSTITGNLRNITENTGGGGVHVVSGTFEMIGGTISGNSAQFGGGVIINGGTFTMNGGVISGNNANSRGGGVYMDGYHIVFTMRNGTIAGNSAGEYGGGVFLADRTNIVKTGGTINGNNSDQNNMVVDGSGNLLARRGHAVYANGHPGFVNFRRKETTAGTSVNLSMSINGAPGSWDD